jgi:N12 class adenine-specific DNA methylase
MLVERPADLMARLAQLPGKMPPDTYSPAQGRKQVSYLTNNTADREGSVTLADGKLYVVRGERLMPLADVTSYQVKSKIETAAREAQIGKLIAMRNAYGALVTAERAADSNTEALRKDLHRQYLAFVKAYGSLEASDGMRILRNVKDPFYSALASLEIDGKPARILKEATLRGRKKLANPSVRDAFVMARNESMDVDLGTIAKLSGKTEAEVATELEGADAIFKTPAGNYEVADIYLSGNVRRKLREAQDAQANAPAGQVSADFARNIAALEKVLPKTVPYFKIEAKLGAPWIKAEHYQGYVARLLGLTRDEDKAAVEVRMVNGSWKVKFTDHSLNNRPEATTQWGTFHMAARLDRMLTAAMNNRSITVKYKDDDGNMQVDEAATKEVSEKLIKLREEFGNWVWKDAERRVWLEENYNEVMNAIATPNFDGSFLDFNGMTLRRGDDPFSLRKHQVDAIWRGLVNGRGLYAHEVGTGKTYTMAGLAVESRRYGLAKKPLIFAHNANSASVAKEFNDMYPAARVLYLDNLAPADLDVRMRQIANDDWDAVVVPHSLISRFALTGKTLNELAAEEIAAMEQEALDAAADDNVHLDIKMMDDEDAMKKVRSATAKELVRARNKIIKAIQDMALKSSKEDAVSFEDLGVDMVIVDEAHEFKKPPVATKMKMRGLNTGTSNMSIALRFLTDYVKRENNGRGIHLFTGTPITNTLTELYNMMRYVMDDVMARDGIKDWDSWFNTFADSTTDVELTAAGEYEAVTRLASFVNTAELRRISGEFMDIVFADDMPEFKPRPTASGKILTDELTDAEREELLNGRSENPVGRPYKQIIVDVAPMGLEQKQMLDNFKRLAKEFKEASKQRRREIVQSGHPANPVLVETGAANAGMDPRLVDMNAKDEPNSKVNRVARNVAALYHEDARATQVVFLERGFTDEGTKTKSNGDGTKTVTKVRKFNLVKDMVAKMVAAGVKESEIAVVDGSVSKEKRKEIADAMNKSQIRVVIGLTKTLGVGVNMQENLRAMHHVDAPWMPGELEQRNGRGWRQGNKWNTVREYRYITERLDGRRWQVLAVKDRFIKLFLKADENTRIIDGDAVEMEEGDGGDLAATLSEAAGDPRVLVREKLKADIEKLENRERQHTYALTDAAEMMRRLAQANAGMTETLPKLQADSAQYEAGRGNFSATIGGEQYTERGAADEAIDAIIEGLDKNVGQRQIGTMHGFKLTLHRGIGGFYVDIRGQHQFEAWTPSVSSIESAMRKLAKTAAEYQQKIEDNKASIGRMAEMQKEPFGQAALLEKKRKMLADLIADLARNPEPAPAWLRHGAPANTAIYVNGQQRVVEGHKSDKDGYFIVTEEGDVPYLDATDAAGMPIYDPVDGDVRDERPPLDLTGTPAEPARLQRREDDRKRRESDPLFARAENDEAGAVAQNGKTPIISDTDFAAVIDRVKAAFAKRAGGALTVSIKPVRGMDDLPPALQEAARRQQLDLGKGVYFENTVYVVQQAHSTAEEVEKTIFHELYGHAATATLFGDEWVAKQNALLKAIGGGAGLYRIAAANQINLHAYADGLAADTTLTDAQRSASMMDELLAHMAGKKTVLRQKINEFIGAVRAWLRAHGFAKLAEYGNTDLAHLLAEGRRSLAAKATGKAGPAMPVFARDPDHAPVFYSTLTRQIDKTVTKSASPLHWAETIMGTSFAQQGVKQDEIQWSGVLDWLAMQQEAGVKKVDKAQLLDYLAENGVRVSETMQGEPAPASEEGLAQRKAVFDQYQPQIDALRQRAEDYKSPSREMDEARDEWAELIDERDRAANDAYTLPADDTSPGQYGQYQLPGGENYRELLLTLPQKEISTADFLTTDAKGEPFGVHATEAEARNAARTIGGTYEAGESISREAVKFQSAHWTGVGNVLAHVRFNDRIDADGQRVLFIEELQSDWQAAGKRQGFGVADVEKERDRLHAAGDPAWATVSISNASKIAPAPFVGKTEAWLSLAVKRMISYAAQNGYDKVAFVNGKQSVERYDLSKQVAQIRYVKRADGTYDVWAADESGRSLNDTVDKQGLKPEQVEEFVGKEVAEKIINGEGHNEDGDMVLSGLDLKVGGEGMKTFYDRIVPNVVNDVLKKLGGGKLGTVNVGIKDESPIPHWKTKQPGFDHSRMMMQPQPGFAISDALREKAQGGLPLFKRGEQRAPNGKASNLPAHLWQKVRTPEFKAWFGDWEKEPGKASQVVDENGEPRVVYHGTNADFTEFDKAKVRLQSLGGFWFAERNNYVGNLRSDREGFNQMPVFLNIRRPVDGSRYAMFRNGATSNEQVQRQFKMSGKDGVRLDNGSDSVWIALHPEQIKSAIGNNGQFNQGNPNILFSRSPADISRQVGSTIKALTLTRIKNKLIDYGRIALQFLGRQQLVEVYGNLFPQGTKDSLMVQYNKLAMQMDADKNDTSAQADTIATDWGKLKDHQALAELMHDATRLQIDPRKKYDLGDIRTNYTDLRARYEALSPGAKAIFNEASAAYEKHYAAVRAAVHDRIGRAMVGNPNRASMLARMDAEFFGKIKGIYFPLARFGDYMVQVNWRGANPNPAMGQAREAIHFAETMSEAQALRTELMKEYPPEKGYQVAQVTLRAEYNAARDSVGRGFLQQMFNMFKTTGMDPSLQDAINQLYLTSLPDLSWAKHGIHRKGTPGFSQDARRAFANHMFHGARYLAKLNYADQLAQALDDMQHYVNAHNQDAGYDAVKAQQVVDEMIKRHDIYMNPKNNKLSNLLTSTGYVFYLGLSPASAAVNLTQTALVAYPILGGRYGFGKAASALLAASQDAVRGHNDMGKVLTGDELLAYENWIKSGLVDVTLAHDLTSIAAGNDNALHGAMGTAMKWASFMFHHAERFNRQATALASYRLAREKGMDHDAAYAASVQDTYASHFDYSSGNRARVMQGDVARVVLLFKQYAQNMIYTFASNALLAIKGDRQAAKTIAGLLTTHALAAGVLGLPVVGMLLAAASMIGGSDDDPWDAEIALRNLFADAFGDKAGEVLAHGLSRLTPWDISARVGLNSLLLPDVQEGLAGAPLAESYLTGLLGAVAGMAVNASKGVYTIAHNGDWQRGLEEMMPAFLRGPLKTLRYAQEGIKDKTGIELVPETTFAEEAGQFLGFSPSRGREAQAGKSAIYQTDKALQQRRQKLMNEYAHHVLQQEDPSSTLQAIQAFNALHPTRRIAPLHLQHSVRLRMQHMAQAKDGIFLPRSRSDARAAGAFADETP